MLRLNSEAGLVTSPNPRGVPLFSRLHLGGITAVRGFRARSIGRRLPLRERLDESSLPIENGATLGGNLKFYQNIELEFPLLGPSDLRGVLFTELGNAWNLESRYCLAASGSSPTVVSPCSSLGDLLHVRASVGLGVRWMSPLGRVGRPALPAASRAAVRVELSIGGDS